jgi:DNA repair photolyase
MFYARSVRWDNLLAEEVSELDRARLPGLADEAVVRRFKTPEFRGITFYEVRAKSIVNHVPGDRFGFNWTINPYRGCQHSCKFCFARPSHTYLDFDAGKDFETKIVVKVNAPELLRGELRRKSWKGELIALGTNTDPYQRAEGHYRLTRGILQELNAARNRYSILTKGTLIQRDIDLLLEGTQVNDVSTAFSVGTIDEEVWRKSEPGTPHPLKRLEVVKKLNDAGIACGVLMAPILPGISDSMEQMQATVRAAAEAGATFISPIVLHLRPGVKEEFIPWLEDTYPELLPTYEAAYRRSNAPKSVTEPITKAVGNFKRRYGYTTSDRHRERRGAPKDELNDPQDDEQLALEIDEPARRAPKWVSKDLSA